MGHFNCRLIYKLTAIIGLLISIQTQASDYRRLVYQGRILRPDSSPVTGSVQFKFQITDTIGTCVMWEETVTQTLSDGTFSTEIGGTSPVFDGGGTTLLKDIFKQGSAINCKGGTPSASITPAATDDRNLSVSFNDGGSWQTVSSLLPIKSVPYALYADNATKVGGFTISSTAPSNGQGLIYNSGTTQWEPQNLTGGGTITSVVAGTGLTGGSASGAATLSFASIASNTLLANTTGGAAAPISTTLNTLLDTVSSTQGSILYRNAAGWVALSPGTSGQYLQTQGAGANPQWATGSGSGVGGSGTTGKVPKFSAASTLTDSIIIESSGKIGIGGTPTAEVLEVTGNVKATAFISTSDRRLKTDIETIGGLDKVKQLRGVRFNWKSNGKPEIGLIAQEVEEVFPDLVVTDPTTGYKAVKYSSLVAPLIESTKDLARRCEMSEKQLQSLERNIASLKEENQQLRSENNDLKSRLDKIEAKLLKLGQ